MQSNEFGMPPPITTLADDMETTRARRSRTPWIISIAAIAAVAAVVTTALLIANRDDGPAATSAEGLLPDATTLGVTELTVRDLDTVAAFYRDAIGLAVLESSPSSVVLGHDTPILRLTVGDDSPADVRDAGLYHTAILYADGATLAEALVSVAQVAPASYQGSADHAVSLAFYLGDPEGNGVELYLDRPRDEWVWVDGRVQMGSAALDPNAFIEEHLGAQATGADPSGAAVVGHMHLKVGDLDTARTFYADTLGFDVVADAEGALFYSAGGYHHHIATNVWQSAGAGVRTSTMGLGSITVLLPSAADVDEIVARLEAAGHTPQSTETGFTVADPWGNRINIETA